MSICWQKTRPNRRPELEFQNPAAADPPWRAGQRSLNSSLSGHHTLSLPRPVPWPSLQTIRVSRLNVAFFYSRFHSTLKCNPKSFSSERAKVAFLISLLNRTGIALARAIWNSQTTIINSFDAFSAHFKEVFGLSTGSLSVADQLIHLHQGDSSASDYTLQFRTLAVSYGWNEAALLTAYRQGLDPRLITRSSKFIPP